MFSWITQHIATILICLTLALIVTAIVIGMLRNKKKGKSACGCPGCSGCSGNSCHRQK